MNDMFADQQPSKRLKPSFIDDIFSFGANQSGQLVFLFSFNFFKNSFLFYRSVLSTIKFQGQGNDENCKTPKLLKSLSTVFKIRKGKTKKTKIWKWKKKKKRNLKKTSLINFVF